MHRVILHFVATIHQNADLNRRALFCIVPKLQITSGKMSKKYFFMTQEYVAVNLCITRKKICCTAAVLLIKLSPPPQPPKILQKTVTITTNTT